MKIKNFFLLLCGLVWGMTSHAEEAAVLRDGDIRVYEVDPVTERVAMYWRKPDGEPYVTIRALLAAIDADKKVRMVTNGGIYGKDFRPLGLYIENGQRLAPLNRERGGGNFFLKPNGVFYLKEGKAFIEDATRFKDEAAISDAVQSGPLMLKDGVIHPRFLADSTSRKIRNAVGITKSGTVIFLFTKKPVTFYELTMYAKHNHDVVDLLYLDGTISQMYVAPGPVPLRGHQPFVTMIVVERKEK